MKAFLINPPTGLYVREDRCQSYVDDFAVSVIRPPMDLMMMATSLEAVGINCKVKDYPVEGGDWKVFKKDFLDFIPDLLILSITTPTLKDDMLSCKISKEINPKVLTIAKGAHFLKHDSQILEEHKDLDIIIRGESEFVIREIATVNDFSSIKGITYRAGNGKIKRNEDRPFLENLDVLPFPARHLVKNKLYTRPDTKKPMAVVETSRGCPGKCIFCLTGQVAGKEIRNRSPNIILDEIEECIIKYNIYNFHFKSDTFTWDKEWVIDLCKKIINHKFEIKWICNSRVDTLDRERLKWMKNAGCWGIGLGIESGNQEILDKMNKGITLAQSREAAKMCKEFQIKSYAYFIIGFPWENELTINDSIEFAIEINPDFTDFFLPYPFPGTELDRIARELNLIDKDVNSKAYSEPILNTLFLSRDQLLQLRKKALRRFYLRPSYIIKTLLNTNSVETFLNYLCCGMKTFKKMH